MRALFSFAFCILLTINAFAKDFDIVVAKDGSGDYTTVQEAVNACPDYMHDGVTSILVKAGTYKERVIIPHNKFRLHIKGEGAGSTRITYDCYAQMKWPLNGREMGTSGSAVFYVHSSYVTFEDLCFENSAGPVGQAVAVHIDGDFIYFKNCSFLGNQDTVYTYGFWGKDRGQKRIYFKDCYIEGTTDFIFGASRAFFENCEIHSKADSFITAASTPRGQPYGYVFRNCRLTAAPGVTRCYLGRPWRPYARTVFINCEMGPHIVPEGWHDWNKPQARKTSFYAEYGNTGPGAYGKKARAKWSHTLSRRQAEKYSFENVMFEKEDGIVWNPEMNY